MFDEKPPEDIFAGTEKPAAGTAPAAPRVPTRLPPPAPAPVMAAPQPLYGESSSRGGGLKTVIIVLIALLAIAGAAYLAYVFMVKTPASRLIDTTVPEASTPDGTNAGATDTLPDGKGPAAETPAQPTFLDSDGDGLTNAEELEAGTSATKADTDADGLGDREEVKVYGTDPRRTDTDGDGFLDGAEVDAGYNPNGPGKLLEVPANGT